MFSPVVVEAWILSLKTIGGAIKAEGLCADFLHDVASDMSLPIISIRILFRGEEP